MYHLLQYKNRKNKECSACTYSSIWLWLCADKSPLLDGRKVNKKKSPLKFFQCRYIFAAITIYARMYHHFNHYFQFLYH